MKPLLSIRQVAERLNVSDTTVRVLIEKGHLRAGKVAGVWRIDEADVEAYFERQKAMNDHPTVERATAEAFDADAFLGPGADRFT